MHGLEAKAHFGPSAPRSSGGKEGRTLERIVSGLRTRGVRGKRPGEECTLRGETGVGQLRGGIVLQIEQIVDLEDEFEMLPRELVVREEIGDAITG